MDSGQTRNSSGPDPNPESKKKSPSKTSTNSEPLLGARVATQSETTKGRKPIQIVAEYELKNVSE